MPGDAREIGPLGTVSRVAVGLAAIVVPIASSGIGWWDWAILNAFVVVAAAVAGLVIAGFARYAPAAFASRHAICSPPACSLVALLVGLSYGMSAITPADGDVVFWVWVGASLLVGAAAGHGGCEVLAFPNAFTGRRDQIGCLLFTPIDAAEARYRTRTSRRPLLGEDR
jgi:4-amino-4-deoxy-L-arabinose transferase-like glycosyltransferase